jgi:hypothetical protein
MKGDSQNEGRQRKKEGQKKSKGNEKCPYTMFIIIT